MREAIPTPTAPVSGSGYADVAGRTVVLHYGDIAPEYRALRESALLVRRDARGRMRVSGPRAAEMIGGLVTNDVQGLGPGAGAYAAALNPRGKIVADVRVFAFPGDLFVDVPPRAADGWQAMVRKYVNPRLAAWRDESAATRQIGLFGPRARSIAGALSGHPADALAALPLYGHLAWDAGGEHAFVARVPDLALEGYEFFGAPEGVEAAWGEALHAGAVPAGLLAFEIARIEAGRPEWGLDMDENTLTQEANLDQLHAVSYTKGCYVGQEVVARVHFRGHVNRTLRGLSCVAGYPPPAGAALLDESGKQVGDVRSGAISPRLGGVALGMVRREVNDGAVLRVSVEGADATEVVVRSLPFPL